MLNSHVIVKIKAPTTFSLAFNSVIDKNGTCKQHLILLIKYKHSTYLCIKLYYLIKQS